MPTFKITCSYRAVDIMVAHVDIEAPNEAEALEVVRQVDENGDLKWFTAWSDCDPAEYKAVEITSPGSATEHQAEAAMLSAYLGEA